jgi:hypothetical protein
MLSSIFCAAGGIFGRIVRAQSDTSKEKLLRRFFDDGTQEISSLTMPLEASEFPV